MTTEIDTEPETEIDAETETEDVENEDVENSQAKRKLRLPKPRTAIIGLVIAALVAATGFFAWQTYQNSQLNAARAGATDAARGYALDLASYDYHNLKGNFTSITANATGSFAQQYKQVSTDLTALIQQMKATSKGSVLQIGVVSCTTDRAVVAAFVDQTITNTNAAAPRVDRNRMVLTLVNSGGRWLLDNVQLQ